MSIEPKSPRPKRAATQPKLPEPTDQAMRVLRRFRVVFNAVKTHFRQVESEVGIGGAQVWALSVVQEFPDIGIGELARAMDIHQSTASNLIKSLVGKKLVLASRAGEDRRSVTLRVTPAGRALVRKAPGPSAGVLPQALASLDPRTLSRLEEDLQALMDVLAADENAGGIPLAQL